ncbi:glycosyltransferase [Planomonospora sp. ID67723]|uniref:glycosyltransferase n=1 Tax=Planomonospora sp. ID67723 TaxID=2738134 RepID=UPI0018C3DBA4|nr:glycosyltransferase [Planomonospora sp. ID67723]MBG0827865.1 glycosyltransferase [Planomonospora sp. ID67723]
MSAWSTGSGLSLGCHIGFGGDPEPLTRLIKGTGGVDGAWTDLDGAPTDHPFAAPGAGRFVLVARTPADLRRAVPMAGLLPRARTVTVVISEYPDWRNPPVPVLGNARAWSNLLEVRIRREEGGSWWAEVSFSAPAPAGEVLRAVSRGLTGRSRSAADTPVVALAGVGACHWRPGDPNVTLAPPAGPIPERRTAPGCDLFLRTVEPGAPSSPVDDVHPIDRAELLHGAEDRSGAERRTEPVPLLGPDDLPPVDELSVCPIGFASVAGGPIGELRDESETYEIAVHGDVIARIAPSGALTEMDVARVRGLAGVEVDLKRERPASVGLARVVCGLAAAGVPVLADPGPVWHRVLGPELAELMSCSGLEDLADPLAREQFSIRLRRSALMLHGTGPRWRRLARSRDVPVPEPSPVSVILCTQRPEMVGFALEQIGRQRGVDVEVVLSLHGFPRNLPGVARAISSYQGTITVVEEDRDRVFGEVLNRAVRRAQGTFLAKMDDDDWYGPDHLSDLLLAQRYSNADLVGAASEFVYLEPIDVTIRREIKTEVYTNHVAGSSMLVSRAMLDEAGGFRPIPRTVDGQLLESVSSAGGRIYRTHGFNYIVSRRLVSGHTWQEPLTTFLGNYVRQWRGFYANPLMETGGSEVGEGHSFAKGNAADREGRQ